MLEEFRGLDLNSTRLEKRFVKTMETLSSDPSKSIWLWMDRRDLKLFGVALINFILFRIIKNG